MTSFLIKSSQNIDPELDALFKSQPPPPPVPAQVTQSQSPSKKRKLESIKPQEQSKRAKSNTFVQNDKTPKQKTRTSSSTHQPNEEDDEDNSDIEANYLHGRGDVKVFKGTPIPEPEEKEKEKDTDTENDSSTIIHESLTTKSKKHSKHGPKQKSVPPDETRDQRDQRTVFVGNLPLEVAQKKPLQNQLQRHILSFVPSAKIESIRFRSIPFRTPTTKLPTEEDTTLNSKPHQQKNPSQREHGRERASSWRQEQEDIDVRNDEKKYLNPHQKKKIAFINQEFHSTADIVHAYLVFAHPIPTENRPANLPPLAACMDPYEAAKESVKKADGTPFLDRILRVDLVSKKAGGGDGKEALSDADPKLTLFVGNLDLATKEEDLRVFFESLMRKERGEPPEAEGNELDQAIKKLGAWVKRVRIIRDKDTQLGKGFGYVQFIDRDCIDEILAMDITLLKFAKRKLRVQRCKTIPGTKLPSSVKLHSHNPNSKSQTKDKADKPEKSQLTRSRTSSFPQSVPITIPKGDPSLGEKLANLSKDQRKKVKADDADRVARRLAKKKARMAMGTSKDRHSSDGGEKRRERVRKVSKALLGKKSKEVKKKGRARSEKSLEKRNMKK